MKIAIIGAGFAGLGTAISLFLHTKGKISIDLFDPKPIGFGVSGYSAGLLHPFPGKRAERVWNADKLMNSTHYLITEASKGLSKSLIRSIGILRPALSQQQIEAFQNTAQKYPEETLWWGREEVLDKVPGIQIENPHGGGLYIKNGLTLDVKSYLQGLYQRGIRFSMQYHQQEITSEEELKGFDKVIFASGMGVKKFFSFKNIPLYPLKGQSIKVRWPEKLPPLPFSLISDGYVVMDQDMKSCIIGATFERKFVDGEPDIKIAAPIIYKKVCTYFPELLNAEVIECQSGIRAIYSKTSLPVAGRIDEKYWFITGLGSKGLLFHGYMAEALSHAILSDNDYLIPSLLRF